jgi:hypothetical protein
MAHLHSSTTHFHISHLAERDGLSNSPMVEKVGGRKEEEVNVLGIDQMRWLGWMKTIGFWWDIK